MGTSNTLKTIIGCHLRFKKQYKYLVDECGDFHADMLATNGKKLYEAEIKISVQDFKNDFKKEKHKYYTGAITDTIGNVSAYKARSIKSHSKYIPNYFIFMVHIDIVKQCKAYLEAHPEYKNYGLATVKTVNNIYADNVVYVIKPRALHNNTIVDSVKDTIMARLSSAYMNSMIRDRMREEGENRQKEMIDQLAQLTEDSVGNLNEDF